MDHTHTHTHSIHSSPTVLSKVMNTLSSQSCLIVDMGENSEHTRIMSNMWQATEQFFVEMNSETKDKVAIPEMGLAEGAGSK